jgi:hypothetical protein
MNGNANGCVQLLCKENDRYFGPTRLLTLGIDLFATILRADPNMPTTIFLIKATIFWVRGKGGKDLSLFFHGTPYPW